MGKAREGPAEKMVLEQSPGWTRGGHHADVGGGMCAEDGTARGEACSRGQLGGLLVAMQGARWEKRCKSGVRSGACAGQEVEQQLGIRTFSGLVRTSASTPGQRLAKQWLWPVPLSTSLLSEALGSDHSRASFGLRAGVGKPCVRAKCHPRLFSTKVSPYLPSPLHL